MDLVAGLAFAANPNVVLITLDSARADHTGFLGTSHATPALDALAKQSLVFEHAYAQAPLTVVSHTCILTGTYPQTNQANEFGSPLPSSLPYLPDFFRSRGYHTAAFVGTLALDPRNGSAPGFDRGFTAYDAGFHQPKKGESRYLATERRGDQVAARAIAWLAKNSNGPFFLWVQLNDAHAPYGTSYDGAVSRADAAAGKLIATLRASRQFDDAIIAVASDHGESLGAHGEETHGVFLYDETVRVPLLLKLPQNQMAAKRIPSKVSLVDLAPTLLEIAGIPVPSQMQGESLLRIAKSGGGDQPFIPEASSRSAPSAGVRSSHGARESICTFVRPSRSSTICQQIQLPPTTWRRARRQRSTPWPRNSILSTVISRPRVSLPSSVRAKSRSLHRWAMWACRNRLVAQQP